MHYLFILFSITLLILFILISIIFFFNLFNIILLFYIIINLILLLLMFFNFHFSFTLISWSSFLILWLIFLCLFLLLILSNILWLSHHLSNHLKNLFLQWSKLILYLYIELKIECLHYGLDLSLEPNSNLPNKTLLSIKDNTVVKGKINIIQELLRILIVIILQSLLNGSKIHWLFDHQEIVWYLKLDWINWLMEEIGLISFPKLIDYLQSTWLPVHLLKLLLIA